MLRLTIIMIQLSVCWVKGLSMRCIESGMDSFRLGQVIFEVITRSSVLEYLRICCAGEKAVRMWL